MWCCEDESRSSVLAVNFKNLCRVYWASVKIHVLRKCSIKICSHRFRSIRLRFFFAQIALGFAYFASLMYVSVASGAYLRRFYFQIRSSNSVYSRHMCITSTTHYEFAKCACRCHHRCWMCALAKLSLFLRSPFLEYSANKDFCYVTSAECILIW